MIQDKVPNVNPSVLANRTLKNAGNIPLELLPYRQFVAWRYVDRGGPKLQKVPINPRTLGNAGSTYSNTWTHLPSAIAAYEAHQCLNGVGFVLTQADPYTMIDMDESVKHFGSHFQLAIDAQALVKRLDTYTELSPSGRGLRLFVRCEAQPPALKCPAIEVYSSERFATLTGNVLVNAPIARADLRWLYDQFAPTDLTANSDPRLSFLCSERLTPSPIDDELWSYIFKINALAMPLFNGDLSNVRGRDHSRAVILLLNSLAIWTQGDAIRMERMIRQTYLDQSKFDDKRGTQTWLQGRILDAILYTKRGRNR